MEVPPGGIATRLPSVPFNEVHAFWAINPFDKREKEMIARTAVVSLIILKIG
jgi:hypothetical protein